LSANAPAEGWQVRLIKPRLGLLAQPSGPAEVGDLLCQLMLARENLLEDAEYQKTVPNQFVVELSPAIYARHYQPLEMVICQQWQGRLLQHLATSNSRQGRREYHFAGQVTVELRAASDLGPGELRVRFRLQAGAPDEPLTVTPPATLPACLELLPDGKLFRLRAGLVTIGRDLSCDIALDQPRVQELRLVSGQHAHMQCQPETYRLFDGSPSGQPSINGTFVNNQPVPPGGQLLRDGDVLILAAVRPRSPSLDTPGVVGLRFRERCE
jgi:hypothetical protein